MKNILVVYSSLNQQNGNSSKLTKSYLEALSEQRHINVTERDLVNMALGHLSAEEMQAWSASSTQRTPRQHKLAEISDTLIADVQNADEIVLAVPMYNFGIPSVLKAWFDRLARAGVTFEYTENGPVGLLDNKPVTVVAARGGIYAGTELDTQTAFIKHFLSFIGLTDVRMVYAEGLAMGDDSERAGWNAANQKIIELTA